MKKFALFAAALSAIIIYALACNETFMKDFTNDWKNEGKPRLLHWDKYKYGDLYGMSYLPQFKIPVEGSLYNDTRNQTSGEKNIDLWIIGDSFLAHALKPEEDLLFLKGARLQYLWWRIKERDSRTISFAPGKRNVLIIEATERLVRKDYAVRARAENVANIYQIANAAGKKQAATPENESRSTLPDESDTSSKEWRIVPENFSQNIETLLFGYEFFAPFKELKAEFNSRLFSRIEPSVSISRDGENLFFRETVNPSLNTSSFKPLSDEELSEIVKNINFVAENYKRKGFDEVFLSLTPNAVTIVEPDMMSYNNLIPRIQDHPDLKVPVIDVFSKMKQADDPKNLYWRNDSHWNSDGFRMWVDETNKSLENFKIDGSFKK